MKSRRPPLNLNASRNRGKTPDAAPDAAEAPDGEAGGDAMDGDDILNAPLAGPSDTAGHEQVSSNPMPDVKAHARSGAIRPDITPPPPTSSPVARAASNASVPSPAERAWAASRPAAGDVLKATGMRPFFFWGAATFISLLWGMGLVAFALGAQSNLTAFAYRPFTLAILALFAIFPIGLVFASAFALRNAAALAREARRTAALTDAMLAPAAAAAAETGSLVESLRAQVDHAVRAVRLAHADISELSQRLATETDRLQDAAQIARNATQSVTQSLQHEREALTTLGASLDTQARGLLEATDRQARMVADASDLAQAQLREAEASLTASTAQIVGAAADVAGAARTASEDLDRQTVRLETAGSGVSDQIRTVEAGLSEQRAGLVSAALSLRADQEDFAVHIENQRAQLTEALAITRVATVDLGETSARGIDTLRDIVAQAQAHFRTIGETAENERTAFETRAHATLSNISAMAADARDDLVQETRRSLEQLNAAATEARRAADEAAQNAQIRVDRLNETIFVASQHADDVFESRFNAARRLIEDSAELIAQAGDQTVQKLDDSFAHTRQTLAEMHTALGELSGSADSLPAVAQARIADIRRSVEEGIAATMAAARRAAEETQAIDAAFQERVKRNYDMLSDAVRLMGVVAGDMPGEAPMELKMPAPERPDTARAEPVRAEPKRAEPTRERDYGRTFGTRRDAPTPPQPQGTTGDRLRLSPLGDEARPATPQPPAPAPGKPQRVQDGWSWRDLLGGMETRETPMPAPQPVVESNRSEPIDTPPDAEFDRLDDLMIAEVAAMGIDAAAVLGRSRLEEAVAAHTGQDRDGARLVVRRVAPAAIRRLGRRLLTDAVLRQQANEFVQWYEQQVHMALMARDPKQAMTEVLSSDAGRAYLLFDATLTDIL